ncbi:His-Xaa-Ser repeat protein HxsA [Stakelama sediminis]|uniref:His-Xaa-Ser repeat protein HxsA n=1 Tax=Stakelama sediminis TaxID=463200 RepID=A0A840Z1S5_9SPHN|nr:peptidoglycan-binding domain-containing protein [Stakelama sediminis]MBB5719948.1 His-Xaa-Ser repeat protein HxsA [Stakelama sediminis]
MTASKFLIASLSAAGFGVTHPLQTLLTQSSAASDTDPGKRNLLQRFTQDHFVTLASHASHSSHSSHASHRSSYGGGHASHTSHRSSTAGYGGSSSYEPLYQTPAPSPPPSTSPRSTRSPRPPAENRLRPLSGRSQRFAAIVRKVEIALLGRGFYNGAIDGMVGPKLRAALSAFQKEQGLSITGAITPETLDALMISTR